MRIVLDTNVIDSGDKDLLDHDRWQGVRVLRPRQFADEFLSAT